MMQENLWRQRITFSNQWNEPVNLFDRARQPIPVSVG